MDLKSCSQAADMLDEYNFHYLTYTDSTSCELPPDSRLKSAKFRRKLFTLGEPQQFPDIFKLPVELLDKIILELDVDSLLNLGLVSRQAAKVVNAIPEYQTIVRCAANALRGIYAIKTGAFVPIKHLYVALFTSKCIECGELGGFMNLLTLQRYCFHCIGGNSLQRHFFHPWRLQDDMFDTLLKAKLKWDIEVHYKTSENTISKLHEPTASVRVRSALRAAVASNESFHRLPRDVQSWILTMFQSSNYVSFIRMPFVDKVTKEATWGYQCFSCKDLQAWPFDRHRLYTRKSFEEHLRNDTGMNKNDHRTHLRRLQCMLTNAKSAKYWASLVHN